MTATRPVPANTIHPLHRLWRLLPAERRRRFLARAAAWLAPKPDRLPPRVSTGAFVVGEVTRASGLGEGARLIHRAFGRLAVPSQLVEAGLGVPGQAADFGLEAPPSDMAACPRAALLLHVNSPQIPLAALRLGRARLRGRLIVGYWNWELPVVPDTWRVGLRFVHEVWVPTSFTAAAVSRLMPRDGRPTIRVVPYPVAVSPPMPASLDRAAFGLPGDAVIVLVSCSVASSMARKNPLAAVAAFRAAFGERRDRLLLLKLGNAGHYPDDLAALAGGIGHAPNIRLETRTLPPADNHALMRCSDIVMSLHRSEGFGLVPAEAMLLAKPVVATAWSGNMDFMDTDSAALVGYTLVPVVDPRGIYQVPGAMWAEPNVAEAADHLSRLAADPCLCRNLGARAKATATARLGSRDLASALDGIGLQRARLAGANGIAASS